MRYLSSILFIIFAIGLFFLGVDPLRADVKDLKGQVALYEQALASSKELQKTQDDLIQKYQKIPEADKTRLNHFLPDTVNNIRFILEIERLANLRGMPIKNIKFDTNVNKKDDKDPKANPNEPNTNITSNKSYGTFPVEFTVDGTYETFLLFLKDVEHNLRLLDIKSISFDVAAPASGATPTNPNAPVVLSFTLKVETYWLK